MWNAELSFDKPWWLLLLLTAPALWLFSYRTLAGLGRVRRLAAIALRTLVLLLLVFALAEVQLLRTNNRMTAIYLLDQSESIPAAQRQLMFDYVVREVAKHRNAQREDRAGVIVFGREAIVEIPPFDADIPSIGSIESYLDLRTDATNLEAALKLAQASFPEDTAKRIVLVSDGNENLGNVRSVGAVLADQSIAIDVVPVKLTSRAEVAVERVDLPTEIRRGQPVETRVVLNNYAESGGPVGGTLKVTRRVAQHEELLAEEHVELAPGKKVLRFDHKIEQPAVYTYRAIFTPDDSADDLSPHNNAAEAITHVRGKGRVLLIEDADNPGDFDPLVERLGRMDIEVAVQRSDELYTSLAELQGYDAVVLANVARTSGADAKSVTNFSDEQIRMLVRNTKELGCGLVMLGGENSFGAGGWANTELEEAMPIDFQIKNAKIRAVGALVLMMHASEMPQGNYWQKVVARKSIEALGHMDYCGLIHWSDFAGKDAWLWGGAQGLVRVGNQRNAMLARLSRMTPGDMPYFEPSMKMALAEFSRVNASAKHMIVISDGDPPAPSNATLNQYAAAGIAVSTVAVGAHGPAGNATLQRIAAATGGQYYVATNPKALPRIFQHEARKVSRPLIKRFDEGVRPELRFRHEMLSGIDGPLPPITGFVMTTVKDHPLVDVSIVSPDPADVSNATILASWTYGGRVVAFTTDTGQRWANLWTEWADYDKFFSQMIRWAMRPVEEAGKFTVATVVREGVVHVAITALDENDEFLNLLSMSGTAIGPDLETFDVSIRQTAAGRYIGQFDADQAGSYFLMINPGTGRGPILTGVTVPYSAEFREHKENMALLSAIAELRPKKGETGQVIEGDLDGETMDALLQVDTFRHNLPKAVSNQPVWAVFALFSACIFFADVLVRRVVFGFEWLARAAAWAAARIMGRARDEQLDERIERLRSSKAAVAEQIDERRAAARFELDAAAQADETQPVRELEEVLDDAAGSPLPTRAVEDQGAPPPQASSYTERLFEAKRQAWKNKKR